MFYDYHLKRIPVDLILNVFTPKNFLLKEYSMIGYPITYGNILEEGNGFTSETVITEISEYWSNEKNQANFNRGYKFGLLVFGIGGVLLTSKAAFASDSGVLPANNGANGVGSCPGTESTPSGIPGPGPGPAKPGGLANVPTTDRGAFGASALGICAIAMKSDAYWVGFVCAAAVIVGVSMASVPANAVL